VPVKRRSTSSWPEVLWQPARQQQVALRCQHTDALGSPVAETNEQAGVVQRTAYTPYGASIGAQKDGVGYTGHVMDGSTGLTYMQQRYMDPTVGVFLSVDPISALSSPVRLFGRYRYVANNPHRYYDPDGRFERVTGSNLAEGRGFAGSRVGVLGTTFRSPMDRLEGGETPKRTGEMRNQAISEKAIAASDGGKRRSEARSAIKLVGIVAAIKANSAASDATKAARDSALAGLGDGRGDAMRHCTWSCEMSRGIGEENARLIGDNHEFWGSDVPEARQMDLNNNGFGRRIAPMQGTCSTNCTEAANNDELDVYIGK
jgi:RHS repeat-associated protein